MKANETKEKQDLRGNDEWESKGRGEHIQIKSREDKDNVEDKERLERQGDNGEMESN